MTATRATSPMTMSAASELQNRATEPRSQARRREGSRQEPDRKRNEGETGGASAPRQPGLEIFGQEQQERSQPGEEGDADGEADHERPVTEQRKCEQWRAVAFCLPPFVFEEQVHD